MCRMSPDAAGGDIKISDCGRCRHMCPDADNGCSPYQVRNKYPDDDGTYGYETWCRRGDHLM